MNTESESHDTPQEQDYDAECIVCSQMFCSFAPAPICEACTIAQHEALQACTPLSKDEAMFVRIATEQLNYWTRDYCAYWGTALATDTGWLVFEHNDIRLADGVCTAVHEAYNEGTPLPKGWHVFTRETARKAYAIGVGRKGTKWFENADAGEVDVCIQLALLGEVRYG